MLKREVLGKAAPKSLGEAFRCGECLHFKQQAHSHKPSLCTELGIKHYAIAPTCYTPDVSKIADNAASLAQITALFNGYTHSQRRILLGVLRQSNRKKGRALGLGIKVYFLAFGQDYISNYLSGYVLGYTSDGQLIVVGSVDDKTIGRGYKSYMDDASVLTHSQWLKKRAALLAKGRDIDPRMPLKRRKLVPDAANYEPPTMENAPPSWHNKEDPDKPKRRKGPGLQVENGRLTLQG